MSDSILAALREGDFAAAAAAAQAHLSRFPDDAEAHHLLGLSLRQQGLSGPARAAFDRAIELAPERAAIHVARATLAAQQGDVAAARAGLERALELDPNQLAPYLLLAELALAAGDEREAEQRLRYAERIQAGHPHVMVLRAQLELARGEVDAAVRRLTVAGRSAPDDALVQGTLGEALLRQGHPAFAEQALRNALARQPGATVLRRHLLRALLAQGRVSEVEAEIDGVLAQHADDAHALALKGQLALQRGAPAEAVDLLRRAVERAPLQQPALEALIAAHLAQGARGTAISDLRSLLEHLPMLDYVWNALLGLLRDDGAAARATAAQWRTARPHSAAAAEALAQLEEQEGNFDAAESAANAAVALEPERLGAQLLLARTELRRGDPAAAQARLSPLHARPRARPQRIALASWMGRIADARGDYEAAVEHWREGHRLSLPGAMLPVLAPPDAALADVGAAMAPAGDTQFARFLAGAPGSGVERIGLLLARHSGLRLLADRFGPAPRNDLFQPGDGSPPGDSPGGIAAWRDALVSRGLAPERSIDWLPGFDAHWLPALRSALPQARFLLVLRDPRDMLLNWLGFGVPQGWFIEDPMQASEWLARALEHACFAREQASSQVELLRIDALDREPAPILAALREFSGGGEDWAAPVPRRDGFPVAFPAGHWQHYRVPLQAAFARLEAIASRLGY